MFWVLETNWIQYEFQVSTFLLNQFPILYNHTSKQKFNVVSKLHPRWWFWSVFLNRIYLKTTCSGCWFKPFVLHASYTFAATAIWRVEMTPISTLSGTRYGIFDWSVLTSTSQCIISTQQLGNLVFFHGMISGRVVHFTGQDRYFLLASY